MTPRRTAAALSLLGILATALTALGEVSSLVESSTDESLDHRQKFKAVMDAIGTQQLSEAQTALIEAINTGVEQ